MTAIATAPVRTRPTPGRAAPRPTPRSVPGAAGARRTTAAPRLQVVEPPRRRYPARAVAVVAVVLVFGSLLVSAMFHSVLVSGQARIDDLERQIAVEHNGLAQDRLRLAQMSSPERIATEAERLGLVVAERQTWIRPGRGNAPVVTGADPDTTDADPDTTDTDTDVVDTTDERAGAPDTGGPRQ